MAVQRWLCKNCNTDYNDEGDAEACEANHAFRKRNAEIAYMKFDSRIDKHFAPQSWRNQYPVTIQIRFSEAHGDFATYKLDYVGYRGV